MSSNYVEVGIQLPKAGFEWRRLKARSLFFFCFFFFFFFFLFPGARWLEGSWPHQHHGVLCEELRHSAWHLPALQRDFRFRARLFPREGLGGSATGRSTQECTDALARAAETMPEPSAQILDAIGRACQDRGFGPNRWISFGFP